ncbi:hypothetical protein DYB32_004835 [Aphanomyces invadans]|nr:hypothetical protein DYB32_004835 [Aphanomyces invadans]
MVKAFIKLQFPVYFSFTAKQCVDMATSAKIRTIVAAVPLNRLLVETDAPDQRPSYAPSADAPVAFLDMDDLIKLEHNDPTAVKFALNYVALCMGRSVDEVATQIYTNAMEAYQFSPQENE